MSFPFRRILSPLDFDENSLAALEVAVQIARQNDGTVLLFHVIPMMVAAPMGRPVYVDIYKGHEETARAELRHLAANRLQGIKHEMLTYHGEPAGAIVRTAKRSAADLIVMATHGRRGLSRVMLGSVAELVLREAPCPVLCIRQAEPDKNLVARWMSSSPVAASPDEKLSSVQARLREGNFRCVPVLDNGRLVGIITDRDLLSQEAGAIDQVEVRLAMTENPTTVAPTTPLHEAAHLLFERKVDALPVLDDGQLVGVITINDILRAFLEED